jgi:hypothetical protein
MYGRRCLRVVVGEVDCNMSDCLAALWLYFDFGLLIGVRRVVWWKVAYW